MTTKQRTSPPSNRFNSTPTTPYGSMSAVEVLHAERVAHAIREALKGNFQPSIDMGLVPEDTT